MSLGAILAKLLGKPKMQNAAPAGWGGWQDTADGKKWEAIGEAVYDELEAAKVNIRKRRIIMTDGAKLTINQATRHVADKTGGDIDAVREHVMLWLEEAGDSDDDQRDDGIDIEREIAHWLDDVRASAPPAR